MKMNYIIKIHDENGIRSSTPKMDDIISKRNTRLSILITDRIFSKCDHVHVWTNDTNKVIQNRTETTDSPDFSR